MQRRKFITLLGGAAAAWSAEHRLRVEVTPDCDVSVLHA